MTHTYVECHVVSVRPLLLLLITCDSVLDLLSFRRHGANDGTRTGWRDVVRLRTYGDGEKGMRIGLWDSWISKEPMANRLRGGARGSFVDRLLNPVTTLASFGILV